MKSSRMLVVVCLFLLVQRTRCPAGGLFGWGWIAKGIASISKVSMEGEYGGECSDNHCSDCERVRSIGKRVAKPENPAKAKEKFILLNTGNVNAFSIGGGHVYATRGLLQQRGISDDEIAFVLGHELGHDRDYHVAKGLVAALGISKVIDLVAGDSSETAEIAGGVVALLTVRGYSRDHERQADRKGVELLCRSGYNPMGALDFFRRLEADEKGGRCDSLCKLLSTHPPTTDRAQAVKAYIANLNENCRISGQ